MKISLFSRQRDDESSFEELVMPHVNNLYRLAFNLACQDNLLLVATGEGTCKLVRG